MAGRSDISAGRAFVTLFVKGDPLTKGLKAASVEVGKFGDHLIGIGSRMLGIGAVIGATLTGAISHFVATGSALADMSARTGVAGSALAELGFAAAQTGASIEDVESGIRKMQKSLEAAKEPGSAAAKALGALGLSVEQLQALSPDKQLELIGEKLSAIEDPGERAAKTMELLGKSGTKLTPMLANLANLRAEANRLGFGLSDDDIARADAFGDAIDRVKAIISGVVAQVGSQLLPVFEPVLKVVETIVIGVGKWVKENGALFRIIAGVTAGIISAGAGILVLGIGFKIIAFAMAGIAAVAGAVGSGLALIASLAASPFVVGAAAILIWANTLGKIPALFGGIAQAGATAGGYLASVFGSVADYFRNIFGQMASDFSTTWQGITDAIASGDLALAMEVASAGVIVAWLKQQQTLLNTYSNSMIGIFNATSETSHVISELFSQAIHISGLAWTEFTNDMSVAWEIFSGGVMYAIDQIANGMSHLYAYAQDLLAIVSVFSGMTALEEGKRVVDEAYQAAANVSGNANRNQIDREKALAELRAKNQSKVTRQRAEYKPASEALAKDFANSRLQKSNLQESNLEAAQAKLAEATTKAKDKRIAKELSEIKRPEFTAPDISSMNPITAGGGAGAGKGGSFSAAALTIMGGGGGPMEKIAKGIEAMRINIKDLKKVAEDQLKAMKVMELNATA